MICIYHSKDLDGWTSAAIVKSKYIDAKLIGYNYGGHLPEIKDGEPIIIVDVCFSMEYMEKLARKSRWNLKWIDHHISQIKEYKNFIGDGETFMNAILPQQDENVAACELTWRHFYPNIPIPEAIRLLGRYDCFGHKGTDEEQKIFLFQYAARAKASNPDEAAFFINATEEDIDKLLKEGDIIYKYLCVEAKQQYAKRFTIELDGYYFACVNTERLNPVNFGIKYHEDKANDIYYYDGFASFWYENGQWTYSLYNENGQVDCSEICKKRGGGGHRGAAGFQTNNVILK